MEAVSYPYIDVAPDVRGGKPRITGTRITVSDVVLMYLKLDQSLEQIAAEYDLSLASVYAAMSYYFDHRAEVDRRMEEEEAYIEAFRKNNPSPLRAKLKALRGE
jgi:uncharacterized protein (DUF433 family)